MRLVLEESEAIPLTKHGLNKWKAETAVIQLCYGEQGLPHSLLWQLYLKMELANADFMEIIFLGA